MSYIKKRVPRKPGMTPQEILADQKTLANWFTENVNLVVYTAGTVLLIFIIGFGIAWLKSEKRDSANLALSSAMAMYQTTVVKMPEGSDVDTEKLEMALESLEDVASEYPRVYQGQTASLFKANVLFRLGRYQDAVDTIEELETKNSQLVNDVNAFYLLARSYEAMDGFKAAIESYQTAKNRARGDMRPTIDIDLARCHELSGDVKAAIAIYREILSEYPDTIFSTRAEKKLAILGITDQETL